MSWKEVEEIKKLAKKHNTAISNVFRVGENWGEDEERRVRTKINEQVTVIPQVSCQPKDHKDLPESGVPKCRGVNGASRTINQRLSDITSDNLMAMLKADETDELQSTEEMLNHVEQINNKIRSGEINSDKLIVGSLDITPLYGSR